MTLLKDKLGPVTPETVITIKKDSNPFLAKWHHFESHFTLETFAILFVTSQYLKMIVVQNLIMERTCTNTLLYGSPVCSNLKNYPEADVEVQKIANQYYMASNLIEFILSSLVATYISQWSDKYGRKFGVYSGILGKILENIGLLLCSYWTSIPPIIIVLTSIPAGFFGGINAINSSIYSIASETSTLESRTVKYATIEASFFMGVLLGTFLGGQIFLFGSIYVFSTAVLLQALSFLWFGLFVKDVLVTKEASWGTKLKDFFNLTNLKESLEMCMRKRKNNGRTKLWLLLVSMSFTIFIYLNLPILSYVFVHYQYHWSVTYFSNVSTIFTLLQAIGTLGGTYFLVKCWNLKEPTLGLIGSLSMFVGCIIKGVAFNVPIYYLARTADLVNGFTTLSIRSSLSKIVKEDELGKMFSLLMMFESLLPLIGNVTFTVIYNLSVDFYPGLIFLIASLFSLCPLGAFVWIMCQKAAPYTKLEDTLDESSHLTSSTDTPSYSSIGSV